MAPPLPGVFVGASCNGTLDQGSPFHIRAHSNYFVVVAFWTFVMCVIYTYRVIGVRCCKTWAIHPVLKKHVFFLFRYSFCHTSYLSPFPFSATTQVIKNHTRSTFNQPMKQLYFICNRCWTYSWHVSILHEPCWGCHILESSGWDFWTPSRGRSAWWRHPCGMFILIFVIRSPFFSDTNQVIINHTRNTVRNLTGQLYFVCIHCWLYLRSVYTLHEPCRGCTILDSMGWEVWTSNRGRSAWWRHPCWMFILNIFNQIPIGSYKMYSFSEAGPSLINFVSWIIMDGPVYSICSNSNVDFLLECHWILDHFDYNQDWILIEFYCKQSFQGRDVIRASHTSHL